MVVVVVGGAAGEGGEGGRGMGREREKKIRAISAGAVALFLKAFSQAQEAQQHG